MGSQSLLFNKTTESGGRSESTGWEVSSDTKTKFCDQLILDHRLHVTQEEQAAIETVLGQGALRGKISRAGFRAFLKEKHKETLSKPPSKLKET